LAGVACGREWSRQNRNRLGASHKNHKTLAIGRCSRSNRPLARPIRDLRGRRYGRLALKAAFEGLRHRAITAVLLGRAARR